MSTVTFLNIAMHGHVNPTLPVVAELVRRGHSVTYHTSPAFREEIAATGATVHLAVREGAEALYVERLGGVRSVRSSPGPGAPCRCTRPPSARCCWRSRTSTPAC